MPAPQPEEIYERTKEEGRRRLSRPVLELGATAIVGGFDVAVGLAIFFLTSAELERRIGVNAAQMGARLGNTLKQNDFKLQSNNSVTLQVKKPQTLKLGKGSATITLVEKRRFDPAAARWMRE